MNSNSDSLESGYSKYVSLTRIDSKNQLCSVRAHLDIIQNKYAKEMFLKILSKFEASEAYLKPVNKPRTAFFRIFWKRADGKLHRCLAIATRPDYIAINIGMKDIPNHEFIRKFAEDYFKSIKNPPEEKNRKIPRKNMYKTSPSGDSDSLYIVDNSIEDEILGFLDKYLDVFEKHT